MFCYEVFFSAAAAAAAASSPLDNSINVYDIFEKLLGITRIYEWYIHREILNRDSQHTYLFNTIRGHPHHYMCWIVYISS